MHHPTDRIAHTTAFVTPVVEHWLEREIAPWVHPMKDRSDDPSHYEQTLLPQSYISLPPLSIVSVDHVEITPKLTEVERNNTLHQMQDGKLQSAVAHLRVQYLDFGTIISRSEM